MRYFLAEWREFLLLSKPETRRVNDAKQSKKGQMYLKIRRSCAIVLSSYSAMGYDDTEKPIKKCLKNRKCDAIK